MAKKKMKEISTIIAPVAQGCPRNSEASILPFADGRLLLAWSEFLGDESADEMPARIGGRWSKDEGTTWEEPFVLQENIGRLNCMSASLLRLASGRILLAFGRKDGQPDVPGAPPILHGMVKWSDDDGRTWSSPINITQGDQYWCMTNDRLVQLAGGRILYPVEVRPGRSVSVWYSDDEGRSWQKSHDNIEPPPNFWYEEPAVIELVDGRVAMYIRNDMGNIHIALSADCGETWQMHKNHKPDMAGHPECGPNAAGSPCLVKHLPGCDDLLLVWNNNRVRTPLTAAISGDQGETWGHYRNIEEMDGWPPRRIHTYASLAFLNGNVHLTYGEVRLAWSNTTPPKLDAKTGLKYRRLPLAWFYEKP